MRSASRISAKNVSPVLNEKTPQRTRKTTRLARKTISSRPHALSPRSLYTLKSRWFRCRLIYLESAGQRGTCGRVSVKTSPKRARAIETSSMLVTRKCSAVWGASEPLAGSCLFTERTAAIPQRFPCSLSLPRKLMEKSEWREIARGTIRPSATGLAGRALGEDRTASDRGCSRRCGAEDAAVNSDISGAELPADCQIIDNIAKPTRSCGSCPRDRRESAGETASADYVDRRTDPRRVNTTQHDESVYGKSLSVHTRAAFELSSG